jgi:protein tyrosine phosphatase (PTP) superfamily phosphohydrolase (DUF442 family)
MSRGRKRRLAIFLTLLFPLLLIGGFIAWRSALGNFGVVEPGLVYRSAQLDPKTLSRTIRKYGIKTVLNLRGPNPTAAWYRAELESTLESGASQIDIPLASDQYLSRYQARTLLQTLETADRPILIHCQFGAERTGLACALVELLQENGSIEKAAAQFSPYFLFLPIQDGAIMRGHLTAYQGWLGAQRIKHDPIRLRQWIAEEYVPGSPSREEWPYDPYPLRLVTGPAALAR